MIEKHKLKTGDVVLQHTRSYIYKPNTWSCWIIRKLTKSYWNHSGEILSLDGEIYVIESLWGWITLTARSEYIKHDIEYKILRMKWFEKLFDINKYKIKALMQLDKRYDYIGILKLFLLICFGYRTQPNKKISENTWRCSEFNAWMKDINWRQSWLPWDFDSHDWFETLF